MDIKSSIILFICIPILVAMLVPLKNKNKKLFYGLNILACLFYLSGLLVHPVQEGFVEITPLFVFSLDKYSWLFLFIIGVSWLITIIYTYDYTKFQLQGKGEKFFLYLSFSIAILTANGLAGNVFTLFIFYLLSIPIIYPLLKIKEDDISIKASNDYLLATLLPALFLLLPACLILYYLTGSFAFSHNIYNVLKEHKIMASGLFLLFILGFSKNSVMPFHYWLPRTYNAPVPVSALVHSVGAVQTGAIALVKIAIYVYGIDFMKELSSEFLYTGWMFYLCGATALYTAWQAYKTTILKKRFSYSTVGQLSYIITALLVGTKISLLGAVLHIVTHSFAKMALFFVAGFFDSTYGFIHTYDVAKVAARHKWVVFCVAVAGLSITGFPFLAGYYSKDYMLLEELHTGHYASAIFLLIGAVLNFLYILPVLKAGFIKPQPEKAKNIEIKKVPIGMAIALGICTIIVLTLSFYISNIISYLHLI